MFKLKRFGRGKISPDKRERTARSVLAAGCRVEGKLICTGATRLEGSVKGELIADELLIIEKSSRVVADLDAQELVICGKVKGNVKAVKRVALHSSAEVEGDIVTPSITIRDGAQVRGKIDVAAPKAAKPAAVRLVPKANEASAEQSTKSAS